MNFISISFFIFLPIVLLLFWLTPNKYRYLVLILGSYFFYSFLNYWLILLILFTTLVSYLGARGIEKYQNKKKLFLVLTIIACLGSLFVFKYLDFSIGLFGKFFSLVGLNLSINPLNIILPVGISFYTFQTLGYVIDVYRGKMEAEKHIGYYALFVSFFPQLVAGPIEKASKLIPELKKEHHFSLDNLSYGLKNVMSGFIKKVLIADFLVIYVNNIYDNLGISSGVEILLATFLFGLVIYCDFSGYSEIAVGISKWLDVDLTMNFNRPYLSSSLKEFWNRWHITLNDFFTEYVYVPLGGSQKGRFRKYLNIFIVFFISGLWHGASVHFILWGIVCGLLLIIEDLLSPLINKINIKDSIKKIIGIVITYLIINICWIFFRAQSISDIGLIFKQIFTNFGSGFDTSFFTVLNTVLLILCVVTLPLIYYLPIINKEDKYAYAHIGLYTLLIIVVSLMYIHNLNAVGESSFIYFQF